jgi:cholesterol oxidase
MTDQTFEHADVVVIGSGFGGSVSAYRLADAGLSVVLLERGRTYPPGTFPRSPSDMGRAFWDPREHLYGMFDVWGFRGFDSVVSSGLGGGSLIYANVLLRKDEHWFVNEQRLPGGGYEPWPVTRDDLDRHYDAVEEMIGVTPYPLDQPAYADTPKTHAMQDAAAELGLDWRLPPLAVSFAPSRGGTPGIGLPIVNADYPDLHGVQRKTCRLCGECDLGCNDGSKNSLDHTYLSAAKHRGADLRTLHEVQEIRPRPQGGYEVDFVRHDPDDSDRTPAKQTFTCDRLVLAAGTYGTSYLLLRSRENFPGLSEALGTRFSGNGDLLTFLMRAKDRSRTRALDASRGPVITSAIRLPDELDGVPGAGRGAYIQDAGFPNFVNWMLEGADVPNEISRATHFLWERFREFITGAPDTNLSAEISEMIGDGALSISSLPLLGMGRDTPDGVLSLRHGNLDVDWTTETSDAYFERVRATMRRISDVLGAEYADNPMWFRKRVITVHPLGGAPMGRHPGEGVCDPYGEIYGYPGLYVADGAALPGPVGANPSLTIAALADRMSTQLLKNEKTTATGAGPRGEGGPGSPDQRRLDPPGGAVNGTACAPEHGAGSFSESGGRGSAGNSGTPHPADHQERTSLSFTEEMKGFYTAGVSNPRAGEQAVDRERLSFRLTITADDIERFLAEPGHTARAEGWIDAAGHGGRRQIERGCFNLFAPAGAPDRRLMKYRLYFTDAEQPRTLTGWKNVFHGMPIDIWPDTSTLFYRVLEGHVEEDQDEHARIVGAGTLHIELADFAQQLTTFRTTGPHGIAALARFGSFFLGELWDVYGPAQHCS